MTMCSGLRARMASSAGTNSSATVQHRQPLASSTMFSSGQALSPQPLRISPSMPMSPNSLTMTASRRPPAFASTWRISVVLPAPRKPVTMVQGTRVSLSVIQSSPGKSVLSKKIGRRRARDEAALERLGPAAPRHHAVGRMGEQPGALDERGRAVHGIEPAEHIGPGVIAAHRGAEPAIAVGETLHAEHCDAGAGGGAFRGLGEHGARDRPVVEIDAGAAGDADIDGGRGRNRGGHVGVVRGEQITVGVV